MQIRNHSYLFSNISSLKSSPLGGYLLTLTNGNNTLKKKNHCLYSTSHFPTKNRQASQQIIVRSSVALEI